MLLKTVKSPIQCLSAPNVIIPTPLKKGLGMHLQMKHIISQPDGMDDSCVGDSEEDDTANLVLDELGVIIGPELPPNTVSLSKVLHPTAGIGLKEKEHTKT